MIHAHRYAIFVHIDCLSFCNQVLQICKFDQRGFENVFSAVRAFVQDFSDADIVVAPSDEQDSLWPISFVGVSHHRLESAQFSCIREIPVGLLGWVELYHVIAKKTDVKSVSQTLMWTKQPHWLPDDKAVWFFLSVTEKQAVFTLMREYVWDFFINVKSLPNPSEHELLWKQRSDKGCIACIYKISLCFHGNT